MGLLRSIRRFFSGAMTLSAKDKHQIVVPVRLRRGRIRLGQALAVDKGYCAVVVCKQKVTDVFHAGHHRLSMSTLPVTDRRINLKARQKKRKKSVISFPADLYFVNLSEFENIPMRTNLKVSVKDRDFKTVHFGIEGSFSIKVQDAEKFVNTLLLVLPRIKKDHGEQYVNEWITTAILGLLERENTAIDQLFNDAETVCTRMAEIIDKKMNGYGFRVLDIKIYDIDLPKRVRQVIDQTSAGNIINMEGSEYIFEKEPENNYIDIQSSHLNDSLQMHNIQQPVHIAQRSITGSLGAEQEVGYDYDKVFGELIESVTTESQSYIVLCRNCGAQVTENEIYCPKCGRVLD